MQTASREDKGMHLGDFAKYSYRVADRFGEIQEPTLELNLNPWRDFWRRETETDCSGSTSFTNRGIGNLLLCLRIHCIPSQPVYRDLFDRVRLPRVFACSQIRHVPFAIRDIGDPFYSLTSYDFVLVNRSRMSGVVGVI